MNTATDPIQKCGDNAELSAPPMPLEMAAVAFFMAAMLVLKSPDSFANAPEGFYNSQTSKNHSGRDMRVHP